MPSQEHEAILELFRNRPTLAPEMLEEVFKETLPLYQDVRIESENLSEIVPRELRADLIVQLLDDKPVLAIILEAQLEWDPDKEYVWPTYVCGGRMRYRCPACLLVVVPDPALAKRLARPIRLGPGASWITPHVLGPKGIPVITDVEEAKERPELAVLSVMAHADSDVAVPVALAALKAIAGLDTAKQDVYNDLVLAAVNDVARLVLEAKMALPNYEFRSESFKRKWQAGLDAALNEGLSKGLSKGRDEGRLETLVHQFERRLRRPLTTNERTVLDARLRTEGAIVLGDVVLDLSPAELEVWLAATRQP